MPRGGADPAGGGGGGGGGGGTGSVGARGAGRAAAPRERGQRRGVARIAIDDATPHAGAIDALDEELAALGASPRSA